MPHPNLVYTMSRSVAAHRPRNPNLQIGVAELTANPGIGTESANQKVGDDLSFANQKVGDNILSWAEEDRPREKFLLKGKHVVTDAELLAILLGSGGSPGQSAVSLAKAILASVDNNLHELGKRSVSELKRFRGVGEAKAVLIAAALELGRRRQLSDLRERPRITCSRDGFNAIAALLADLHHEEFWILLLNKNNEVFARERLSTGGQSGTVIDAKMVYKTALDARAASIIAVHNHPSGSLQPSQADLELTRKLRLAGEFLELPLLDHLIVSERGYYSFADEGVL